MNLVGHHRRSVGAAFIQGMGESGGILGTFTFPASDGPYSRLGYTLSFTFIALCAVASIAYYLACWFHNRSLSKAERIL